MIVGTAIMIVAAVVTGIIFSTITRTMQSVEQETATDYDKHYAFVAEEADSDFWQEVFSSANEQARDYNAAVTAYDRALAQNPGLTEAVRGKERCQSHL